MWSRPEPGCGLNAFLENRAESFLSLLWIMTLNKVVVLTFMILFLATYLGVKALVELITG